MENRIYRSVENCKVAGVCGGIGEYFKIDPVIPRLLAVLLTIFHGVGLIAYIIAWIIIPKRLPGDEVIQDGIPDNEPGFWNSMWPGVILIAVGGVFLFERFIWWFDVSDFFWPALLVGVGGFLIYNSTRKERDTESNGINADEASNEIGTN